MKKEMIEKKVNKSLKRRENRTYFSPKNDHSYQG